MERVCHPRHGASAARMSWSRQKLVSPPRYATKGSKTSSLAPTLSIALSISGSEAGMLIDKSAPSLGPGTTRIRVKSAPAASRRGTMVSAAPSSALRRTTPARAHSAIVPSGMGAPFDTRAAKPILTRLLPRPGSPSRIVSFPSGSRAGQSQPTFCGLMSQATAPSSIRRVCRSAIWNISPCASSTSV